MKRNPAQTTLETLIVVFAIIGLILIWAGASNSSPDNGAVMAWMGVGLIAWALLTLVITLAAAMVGRMIVGPPPKHAERPLTDGNLAEG